ncbi:DUF6632 domain-containing protein [Mycolicibacterium setense]
MARHGATGLFLISAARRPEDNVSLIWFTAVSSIVHAAIMAVGLCRLLR